MTEDNQILSAFWATAKVPLMAYAGSFAYGDHQAAEEGFSDAIRSLKLRIIEWWRETPEEGRAVTTTTLPWLFRRTKDRVRSARRKRLRHECHETVMEAAENHPEKPQTEASPHIELLQKCLDKLAESERNLLQAVLIQDQSDSEIAESLGISQNTVTVRKLRALDKLRCMFEAAGVAVYSKMLIACLAKLPDDDRHLFDSIVTGGLSTATVAQQLGISEESVIVRKQQILKKLREWFRDADVPFPPHLKNL